MITILAVYGIGLGILNILTLGILFYLKFGQKLLAKLKR